MLCIFNNSSFNLLNTLSANAYIFMKCSMCRRPVNESSGCGSKMTSPTVWDPKVMPDLITMRYELIYVYVEFLIFVPNCLYLH